MKLPHKWIKPLARAGYSARGGVYFIVGLFAVLAAFDAGEKTDTEGALQKLLSQPFGSVLVWIIIVGLVGYVIWRLIQSLFDTDDHGWTPKGLAVRAGLLTSAGTYLVLTGFALSLLGMFSGGGEGGGGRGPFAEYVSGLIGARWVSLGLGLIFAGMTIAHWFKAVTRRYADHFDTDEAPMALVHPVSILGLIARGFVFATISVMLFLRFWSVDTETGEKPGLKDALAFVQSLPFGGWLLAVLGVGLMIFVLYSMAEGRWRRINVEDA